MTAKIQWTAEPERSAARRGLHHEVAERVGLLIAQGELPPGMVLPNEMALGEKFGVSRTAIREAVKVLASKGLVEVRRKTGTRVREQSEWKMLDPEVLGWLSAGSGIAPVLADLMEARLTVEPAAARMAALRATPEERHEIREACQGMAASTGDLPASVECDLRFHLAVLAATHNVFLRPFGALIQAALRASFRVTNGNPDLYRRSLELHVAVADAVEAGDGAKAEAAMAAVLGQTRRDIDTQMEVIGKTGFNSQPGESR